MLSQLATIQRIEGGKWSFFVRRAGQVVSVMVSVTLSATSTLRRKPMASTPTTCSLFPNAAEVNPAAKSPCDLTKF
jgi:hypothetical protein